MAENQTKISNQAVVPICTRIDQTKIRSLCIKLTYEIKPAWGGAAGAEAGDDAFTGAAGAGGGAGAGAGTGAGARAGAEPGADAGPA
uniref:Uncharacterized protein n=1 Tax=Romanomermis culicivorax TaxID=13658 RepID=A0A915KDZ4_ROMCU